MDRQEQLDRFSLALHGDRHERGFWPLLSNRFPSYEILWRRLIVPLTFRIEAKVAGSPHEWIRLRPDIPKKYEEAAMVHYSVFYFLGRAVKRFEEEETALDYPEDVFFLLDSVGDNLKHFLRAMNDIGVDSGITVFKVPIDQFPREFRPFKEISDYRDTFLHNAVIGRGIGVGKSYIPKWHPDKSVSPLERAKVSWRAAEQTRPDELISTTDLLERLIADVCCSLESFWREAVGVVTSQTFQQKMARTTGLAKYPAIKAPAISLESAESPGGFSGLTGSATFAAPSASGDYFVKHSDRNGNK